MIPNADLHDATLEKVSIDWATGQAEVRLKTAAGPRFLRAFGTTGLVCPRRHPWGPSESVNEVRGPRKLEDRLTLEIEMQSGDVIEIEAASFATE
jgi:hypothetical protein